ncbi:hypothetical protein BO71DRAFT_33240 [Aspergillus ellipticus CBS 707.79]|uniref:Uncharacterized protein n=1 Tax=Aspergillus ellipticus CBS 707.79 TaxID=1448320 RepID=A0A319DM86_9EURO|nr:hypothetical protein BO71DRAFT_33240 [Aspergillus ellipticus CBS 707.79]
MGPTAATDLGSKVCSPTVHSKAHSSIHRMSVRAIRIPAARGGTEYLLPCNRRLDLIPRMGGAVASSAELYLCYIAASPINRNEGSSIDGSSLSENTSFPNTAGSIATFVYDPGNVGTRKRRVAGHIAKYAGLRMSSRASQASGEGSMGGWSRWLADNSCLPGALSWS